MCVFVPKLVLLSSAFVPGTNHDGRTNVRMYVCTCVRTYIVYIRTYVHVQCLIALFIYDFIYLFFHTVVHIYNKNQTIDKA